MAPKGHEDAFPRPKLSARCRFSQRTFAGTRGNGRDAPIPAIREAAVEPQDLSKAAVRRARDLTCPQPKVDVTRMRENGSVVRTRRGDGEGRIPRRSLDDAQRDFGRRPATLIPSARSAIPVR